MYNPWNMNGGYYPPQQQMQPPPQPQWMASAQAQIPKAQAAANQQARLQERIGTLQEQYKGAGTEQQAGMQQRIDEMQAKLKAQQGTATGAQRENYGWRQERRQAKNAMAAGNDPTMAPQQKQPNAVRGGAQPEPAMMMGGGFGGQMNGMAQYFGQLPPGFGQGPQGGYGVGGMGMGGGMPQYGGMNYGGGYGVGGMGMGGGMPQYGGMNYGGGYGGNIMEANTSMGQPDVWGGAYGNGAKYGGYNPGANQTGLAEQGQMPTGAQRPGMQYRQDRRQARQGGNEMARTSAPNPGPQQGGWDPAWGTPTDQFGNPTTVDAYNQRMQNFKQNGIAGMMSPTDFQTKFGHLVPSSGGNSNVYKVNGSNGDDLYHYDPTINDWKHMTADEYRGYGDYNYQSPLQSEDMARRAGAKSASNYW